MSEDIIGQILVGTDKNTGPLERIEEARSWLRDNQLGMSGEVIDRCRKRIDDYELALSCD